MLGFLTLILCYFVYPDHLHDETKTRIGNIKGQVVPVFISLLQPLYILILQEFVKFFIVCRDLFLPLEHIQGHISPFSR